VGVGGAAAAKPVTSAARGLRPRPPARHRARPRARQPASPRRQTTTGSRADHRPARTCAAAWRHEEKRCAGARPGCWPVN